MVVDLYTTVISAPGRLVQLTAAALGVKLNVKQVNLQAGEHLTPEYLKLNPQHTVPTLVDDGFSLWESRAISRYLVYEYGKDSGLYPTESKARALVDQRLDFDIGTLYSRFADYVYPKVFAGAPGDPVKLKRLEEALGFLNTFLEKTKFAAGSTLTLADLCLVVTVSNIDVCGISLKPYPNVEKWYNLVKSTAPEYEEANGKGAQAFKQLASR